MTIFVPTEKGKVMEMAFERFGKEHLELTKVIERYFGADAGYLDISCLDLARVILEAGWTKQEWIPVTERLPEKYGKYLCRYVFNGSAEYPHIEAISYYPTMMRFQGEGSCGMRVTHWMPLPEAPKGE